MKTKDLKEIQAIDDFILSSIIGNWNDYDSKSVLLAYVEFNRRKIILPEILINKFNY